MAHFVPLSLLLFILDSPSRFSSSLASQLSLHFSPFLFLPLTTNYASQQSSIFFFFFADVTIIIFTHPVRYSHLGIPGSCLTSHVGDVVGSHCDQSQGLL